jgi:hypothetical protein
MTAITPCGGCPSFEWCQRRGCICWNERSRFVYFELHRRSKETNDWIDQFERDFLSPQVNEAPHE